MQDDKSTGRRLRKLPRFLTDSEVEELRQRHTDGETQASLARAFGITPSTVSLLIRGLRRTEPYSEGDEE